VFGVGVGAGRAPTAALTGNLNSVDVLAIKSGAQYPSLLVDVQGEHEGAGDMEFTPPDGRHGSIGGHGGQ
jgi:hypothetical protein